MTWLVLAPLTRLLSSQASWSGSTSGSTSPADCASRVARARLDPVAHLFRDGVAHGTGPAVELGRGSLEEAPARKDLALHVGEVRVAEAPEPADADGDAEAGLQDLLGEDPSGFVDGRELELLFGAEMREEPALADAEIAGQALKGDRLQALG